MTLNDPQLAELLRQAAPHSDGVDFAEVSRRGRRLYRRRRVMATACAVIVGVAAGSLATVFATSGHPHEATLRPRPLPASAVTATLTPTSSSATAAGLRLDVAVLNHRLALAGIHGQVQTGNSSLTLHLPAASAGSVSYLAATGGLSFRIPSVVEQAPARTTPPTGSCESAVGGSTGEPPPCITARLAAGCPTASAAEGQPVPSATDWIVACDTTGTIEYALGPEQFGGATVNGAQATTQSGVAGTATGQWAVNVDFTSKGQSVWTNLTDTISKSPGCPASAAPAASSPVTCQLAVVLDGIVQSAPIIQERIPGSAEIAGAFTEQSAKALAAALSSGTLPVPLTIVSDVTGTLRMTGGPPGATTPGVAGSVSFQPLAGGQPRTATADGLGSFSISLPPGQYSVTGTSPDFNDGRTLCRAEDPVTVGTSKLANVDVDCVRR